MKCLQIVLIALLGAVLAGCATQEAPKASKPVVGPKKPSVDVQAIRAAARPWEAPKTPSK